MPKNKKCNCLNHTLYTYTVKTTKNSKYFKYNNWEYTGVHSCSENCSGNFMDRHYLGSATDKNYQKIKKNNPEILILSEIKFFKTCEEADKAEIEKINAEYILRKDTFNKALGGGRINNPRLTKCNYCEGTNASHTKTCILYITPNNCKECLSIKSHKKTCSKFFKKDCLECGGKSGGPLQKLLYISKKENL